MRVRRKTTKSRGVGKGGELREKQNLMGGWGRMLTRQDLMGGRVGKNTYGEGGKAGRK
jgi:hypothetical protein